MLHILKFEPDAVLSDMGISGWIIWYAFLMHVNILYSYSLVPISIATSHTIHTPDLLYDALNCFWIAQ